MYQISCWIKKDGAIFQMKMKADISTFSEMKGYCNLNKLAPLTNLRDTLLQLFCNKNQSHKKNESCKL